MVWIFQSVVASRTKSKNNLLDQSLGDLVIDAEWEELARVSLGSGQEIRRLHSQYSDQPLVDVVFLPNGQEPLVKFGQAFGEQLYEVVSGPRGSKKGEGIDIRLGYIFNWQSLNPGGVESLVCCNCISADNDTWCTS